MKRNLFHAALAAVFALCCMPSFSQTIPDPATPDATYKFAEMDGQELFLDDYLPHGASENALDVQSKPTIIFVFGGGFKSGTRDGELYRRWFRMLLERGYRVVSIDYRLGLKDADKAGLGQVKQIHDAVEMAVDDLVSATEYLIAHAGELMIDPGNLVISGSSAGAMTVIQADWELSNRAGSTDRLPKGFRYAGVISFAGAILSDSGMISYRNEPDPTLFLHGTVDKIVNYNQIRVPFIRYAFFGSSRIAKLFSKNGYNYSILRYKDHGHDIANSMIETFPEQIRFLEANVEGGQKRVVDAMLDDPAVPVRGGAQNRKQLYAD